MVQSDESSQKEYNCALCGKTTQYPIELNEKQYCSSTCISKYREEVGERQYEKDSIATFEKKRDTGWIPERAIKYINMCQRCKKEMKEMCKASQYVSGLNRDKLRETETVPWCCHARFNLSSSLTDRTAPLSSALKVQTMAEEMAKNPQKCEDIIGVDTLAKKMSKPGGLKGVTTTILDIAAAEMAANPEYKRIGDNTPKEDGEIMIHYAACLECDPVFGAECEEQAVEKELNNCVEETRKMTHSLWCEHSLMSLSTQLLNKSMTREKLKSIINSAEEIVKEKNDPGVTTHHLFITLGRAVE